MRTKLLQKINTSFLINKSICMIPSAKSLNPLPNKEHENRTFYHQTCGNKLDYCSIIPLIEHHLRTNSNSKIIEPRLNNINIDANRTIKCCNNLKMQSIFQFIKTFCLKCQRLISQLPPSQRKFYLDKKISFCTKCLLDIQITKEHKNQKNSFRQLLENIVMLCKEQTQQNKQSNIQHENLDELNNMTTSQLIKKILEMKQDLNKASQQIKRYKDSSQRNFEQMKFYKTKCQKLQYQNRNLKSNANLSNSSSTEKEHSTIIGDIQSNNLQGQTQQQLNDRNSKFHQQMYKQHQKMQALLRLQNSCSNNYQNVQGVTEQKINEKQITRSERKPTLISVFNQNQRKTHMNTSTPVNNFTKKQNFKDFVEPVVVPIMIKKPSNNN